MVDRRGLQSTYILCYIEDEKKKITEREETLRDKVSIRIYTRVYCEFGKGKSVEHVKDAPDMSRRWEAYSIKRLESSPPPPPN